MGTGLDLAGISSSLRMSLTHEITGGTTTVYIFSGTKVISEYENGTAVGSPTREYIYSGTQLLATMEGSAVKYYHQDHLSNRVITDANSSVVEQKGHLPFGETWYGGGDKWKFTTYERDAESGNDYAIFRSYVNRLGRFSSPDPLAGSTTDPQSLNRYSYALNDPSNGTDPLGLFIGIPPEIPDIWWLLLMFGGGGGRYAPLLDGSEGREGGGGKGKPLVNQKVLDQCLKNLFQVSLALFFQSRPGSIGGFVGVGPNNAQIAVKNDARSFSAQQLTEFAVAIGNPPPPGQLVTGYTRAQSPGVNYTANNLSPLSTV